MKVAILFTLIFSSILVMNSEKISSFQAMEKCSSESVLVGFTRMLNSFYQDKTNISALLSDAREIYSRMSLDQVDCLAKFFEDEKIVLSSRLSDFGFLLLKTSNCLKDVGPVFILLDNVLTEIQQQTRDWQNIIMSSVMTGFLSYQSYNDCKVLFDGILNFIRNRN